MAPSHSTIKAAETAIQQSITLLNAIDNKVIIAYKTLLEDRYLHAKSVDKEYIAFQLATVNALISFKVSYQWHKRLQKETKL